MKSSYLPLDFDFCWADDNYFFEVDKSLCHPQPDGLWAGVYDLIRRPIPVCDGQGGHRLGQRAGRAESMLVHSPNEDLDGGPWTQPNQGAHFVLDVVNGLPMRCLALNVVVNLG